MITNTSSNNKSGTINDYVFHASDSRGLANHGWLISRHTFSFANYYDPDRIHFGALRVLNDDIVKPGMGFGAHPHKNMEIISIPLHGALEHKDSTGHSQAIHTGDVQIMSAGSGIQHSEYNHSQTDDVNFLQIWVFPKEYDIKPRYEQKTFDVDHNKNQLVNVVAPDNNNAVWINQNAWFYLGNFDAGNKVSYTKHNDGNGVYVFLIEGKGDIEGIELNKRDAIGIEQTSEFNISFSTESKVLLMEIPMSVE